MFEPFVETDGPREPPPIPSASSDSAGHAPRALLLWVRSGAAQVRIDDAPALRIPAGEGIWIPADGWDHRLVVTEPGTVAFPLFPEAGQGVGAPTERTRFEVPPGWQDWLIQHFNLMVTPLAGSGYALEQLFELLRRSGARRPLPRQSATALPGALEPLAMPRAVGARAVAEELMRDPALDHTVEGWATRVFSSARTLRRDFRSETGLTFEQWRLSCRLGAAVELLAAGYAVDQVATRVGFASRNGFTRAFKQQVGSTLHEFRRELAERRFDECSQLARGAGHDHVRSRLVGASGRADSTVLRGGRGAPAAPELLPVRTASHTDEFHVLSWVYRGSGYLDLGDHRYERRRGTATWIPADVEHVTGLRQGSVSLPLGVAGRDELPLTEPIQADFSPAWDDFLMFSSVSARSPLRPADHDESYVLELFHQQLAAQRARSAPMPTDGRAHAAASDFLRTIGTRHHAHPADLPAEVHRAFRDETGMTFATWRYTTRMRLARELLATGAAPSTVSRRVGYAHLPNFSSAFSRFHGHSPRDHQARSQAGDQPQSGA